MAYVDDPNQKQNEGNTMQPLSPAGGQPAGDAISGTAPQGGDSTAGMGQGGASTTPQTAPSPTQAQKPSSGMFTNIRSYLQANQGGGERIAQSVGQNIGRDAQQIQQGVQQAQQRTQGDIDRNKQLLADEKAFATDLLGRAGTAVGREDIESYERSVLGENYDKFKEEEAAIRNRPLPHDIGPNSANERARKKQQQDFEALREQYNLDYLNNPRDEEYQRFRDLAEGRTQFRDVRDLDIGSQRMQADNLSRLADRVGIDEGRLELLQRTFGNQGNQYTRGQSSLDNLMFAGSEEGRQALQDTVQGQSQNVRDLLTGTEQEVAARRQALDQMNRNLSGDVLSVGQEQTSNVLDAVNQGMIDMQTARAELAEQLGITEQQAEEQLRNMAAQRDELNRARQANEWIASDLSPWGGYSGYTYGGALGTAQQGRALSEQQREALELAGLDPSLTMSDADYQKFADDRMKRVIRYNKTRNKWENRGRRDASGGWIWDVGGGYALDSAINRMLGGEASALRAAQGDDVLARQLLMSGGNIEGLQGGANELYESLKAGQDITTQTAATQEQAQRYLALQDLLQGRGIGDRTLNLDQAGDAQQQQQLLDQARLETLRKLGIG